MKKETRKVVAFNFPSKAEGAALNQVINGHNIFTPECGDPMLEDSVYMSSNSFSAIMGKTREECSRAKKRLTVVKIKSKLTRRVIYRKYVFNPDYSGLNNTNLALHPASIRELGENSQIVGSDVFVSPGCVLLYFWNHPFHATRISMKLGIISVVLALVSIIITIVTTCSCC